jgi:hypothetical protein
MVNKAAVKAVGMKAAATAPSEEGPFSCKIIVSLLDPKINTKDHIHTDCPLRIPMLSTSKAV